MPADRTPVTFDYGIPAELFMGKRKGGPRQSLRYRRFATAAEAIRFAVEELPAVRARWAPGCWSVTNASMATTFNAFTRAMIFHCNGVCRSDFERQWVHKEHTSGKPSSPPHAGLGAVITSLICRRTRKRAVSWFRRC